VLANVICINQECLLNNANEHAKIEVACLWKLTIKAAVVFASQTPSKNGAIYRTNAVPVTHGVGPQHQNAKLNADQFGVDTSKYQPEQHPQFLELFL